MQSKEEIEKAKEILNNENVLFKIQKDVCLAARISIENAIKYIEQLETDKQELMERLEGEIKEEREIMRPLEHKSMAFHYANGRETLAQDILKILKEESNE